MSKRTPPDKNANDNWVDDEQRGTHPEEHHPLSPRERRLVDKAADQSKNPGKDNR